jgi:hypothetical protein
MVYLDPISLSEHMAILPMTCINCDDDIEMGDDCYVDTSAGIEEKDALIYCVDCVEQYWEELDMANVGDK